MQGILLTFWTIPFVHLAMPNHKPCRERKRRCFVGEEKEVSWMGFRRGEREDGPHFLTWRELRRSYEPKRPRHTKKDLFYFSPSFLFSFSLFLHVSVFYTILFLFSIKNCFLFSYEFPIQCSIFLCQNHDLFPSSFPFFLFLSLVGVEVVEEEEECFPTMVFRISCHVPLPDAKLGHLVYSDAHIELSACLDKIRPSYCVIPNYKTLYSELTHAPKHVYD